MRSHFLTRLLFGALLCSGAAGCGQDATTATASLTWQIVAPNTTSPALTCQEKGVVTVRVQLTPAPAAGGLFDFPCANMAGETLSFPSGTYQIQTIALGAQAQALAQLTFQQRLFGITNLGLILFQVP